MKRFAKLGVFLGLLLLGPQVSTAAYTYDFSTMGYFEGQGLEGLVLDYATFTSETGALYYSDDNGGGLLGNLYATSDISINFSAPVNEIKVTAGDDGFDYDRFALSVYQYGTDTFLGTFASPQFGGPVPEWYTLSIPYTNVGRVVFDPGNGSPTSGAVTLPGSVGGRYGVVLTDFSYNTIPAPGAVVLCAIGAPVVAWLRRRRTLS